MSNETSIQAAQQKMRLQQENAINWRKFLITVTSYWHYFLITLILALCCALLYNKYTIPSYRISATLLINEERQRVSIENNQLLEGYGLRADITNLDNQIMILLSRTLIGRTLEELPFNIEYYKRGLFNKVALYPNNIIKIVPEIVDSLPTDIEFAFKYLDSNMFMLDAKSKDTFALHTLASFGDIIKCSGGSFHVESEDTSWLREKKNHKIYFINHSRKRLVESYSKRLKSEKISRTGTIVKISLVGTNKTMDKVFLNKLTEIFLNNSLEKKNEEAIRTIQFIDDQLIGISDSLVITENKLQQFRSQNRVMNLSAQGQVIIDQAMSLENEKARIEIEANYYDYLVDYLAKENASEVPVAPATMGIIDPGLTKLVADLADLQGQLYSKSLGAKNPMQSQIAQRVSNIKEALRETLNGLRRANILARNENMDQIRTINAQAAALPITERKLLGIERKFKLNDELYTFLLERRAEAQIQKASNIPDNQVVDPSEVDNKPVKPKKLLVFVLALMAGVGIPLLWILIVDTFSNRVRGDEDIKKLTDIPITGYLPHSSLKKNTVVLDEPGSQVAEAFRSLRARMRYFTKGVKVPIILITSSMREEGKTFAAINLASAFSLIGKKTVLLGFDLRKPKIHDNFGISNGQGISTWLTGKAGLQDIIKATKFENLSLIPAGPIPLNPSELIALEKTDELLKLLKDRFECIIIDSSSIGTVSDGFHLASLADTCILLVRQNTTLKDIFERTINELKVNDIKNISLVFNDLGPNVKFYGYGGKHGYSYGK